MISRTISLQFRYLTLLAFPTLLLFLIFKFSISFIVSSTSDYSQIGQRISTAVPYILMGNHLLLLGFLLLALRIEKRKFADVGMRTFTFKECFLGLGVAFALFALQRFFTIPILVHLKLFQEWNEFPGIAYVVSATVFAGLIEEMVFRGYGISSLLRAGVRPIFAVLITSAAFALFHYGQGWAGVLNASIMGLILGFTFLRVRSLPVVVVAHALANFLFIFSSVN